jgi:hypothetical protein
MPLSWILFLVGIAISVFIIRWCFMAPSPSGKLFRLFIGFILILMSSSILTGIGSVFFVTNYDTNRQIAGISSPAAPYTTRMMKIDRGYESSDAIGTYSEEVEKKQTIYNSRTIQAGPSLPTWSWRSVNLSISGPISADHKIELVFIKPWLQKIFSILRLVLLFALVLLLTKYLLKILDERNIKLQQFLTKQTTTSLILLSLLFIPMNSAQAEVPNPELLKELENRIIETTCRGVSCTSIDSINIELNKNDFLMTLSTNSKGPGVLSLPGTLEDLNITEVTINSTVSSYLRLNNQFLEIKLEDGLNKVIVKGLLPEKNALTIRVPQKPLKINLESKSWDIGAYDQGGSNESIAVSRIAPDSVDTKTINEVPKYDTENWFVVERNLKIGDQIKSYGAISRIGDISRDKTVLIPLKPSEQLTVANLISKERNIIATFKAGESVLNFESTFEVSENLTLTSEIANAYSEIWNIECDDYISCEFKGDLMPNR